MIDKQRNYLLYIILFLTHTLTLPPKYTRWFNLSKHLHNFSWRQLKRWFGVTKNRCPHITTKKHELCVPIEHNNSWVHLWPFLQFTRAGSHYCAHTWGTNTSFWYKKKQKLGGQWGIKWHNNKNNITPNIAYMPPSPLVFPTSWNL